MNFEEAENIQVKFDGNRWVGMKLINAMQRVDAILRCSLVQLF